MELERTSVEHACNDFGLSGNFDVLPTEIVFVLFSFLEIKDLCLSARVSRNWKLLCENPHVWRRICHQLFGCELVHKKKRPSSYHSWKEHCIMVYQCVRANAQGKRAVPKEEEMCFYNHHKIHIPSLTTYLLLDLTSFSLDQSMDWTEGANAEGDPVRLQQEAKEAWKRKCLSSISLFGRKESEEKGEVSPLLDPTAATPFSTLLQCVVSLEKIYLPSSYMNQGLRPGWATTALAATDIHDVAGLIEQMERNISWSAVDHAWREERTPWRTDIMKVMNRKTRERLTAQESSPSFHAFNWNWYQSTTKLSQEEKIRKALIELEQNVAWEAVQQRWRKERHTWLASLQASTEFPALMQHLLILDEVLRESSFKCDWKETQRSNWKQRAAKGTQEGGINFTQFAALLLELEENLLAGCFLPNWSFQAFTWRHPLKQMEQN